MGSYMPTHKCFTKVSSIRSSWGTHPIFVTRWLYLSVTNPWPIADPQSNMRMWGRGKGIRVTRWISPSLHTISGGTIPNPYNVLSPTNLGFTPPLKTIPVYNRDTHAHVLVSLENSVEWQRTFRERWRGRKLNPKGDRVPMRFGEVATSRGGRKTFYSLPYPTEKPWFVFQASCHRMDFPSSRVSPI
jgi:hypothetical protein